MPLSPLSPPPVQQPFDIANGKPNPAWTQWFNALYLWMGRSSGTSPLSISGNAATASTASGVDVVMNAGNPEGNQQASPGVFYIDTDTNTVYVKSANDDATGWQVL